MACGMDVGGAGVNSGSVRRVVRVRMDHQAAGMIGNEGGD